MNIKYCCYECEKDKVCGRTGWPVTATIFIVCHECGNKRCPKATNHANPCSGSNEPGQNGSRYV